MWDSMYTHGDIRYRNSVNIFDIVRSIDVKENHKSFLICYLIVPTAFYFVDLLFHSDLLRMKEGTKLLMIQIILPLVVWSTFKFLLGNSILRIERPIAGAWGASIGLVHLFPIYFEIGAHYLWEPVGQAAVNGTDIVLFLINFLVPVVTFTGATYDGTLLVIPLSILLNFRVASKKIGSSRFLDFGF